MVAANSLVNTTRLRQSILGKYGLNINNAAYRTLFDTRSLALIDCGPRGLRQPFIRASPLASTVAQVCGLPAVNSGLAPIWGALGRNCTTRSDKANPQTQPTDQAVLRMALDFTYTSPSTRVPKKQSARIRQRGSSGLGDDFVNRQKQQLHFGYSRPLVWVLAANCELPAFGRNNWLSMAARD